MSCDQHWKNSVRQASTLAPTVHVEVFRSVLGVSVRACEETQAGRCTDVEGFCRDGGTRTPEGEPGWRRG